MHALQKVIKLIKLGVFCKWFTNVNKQNGFSYVFGSLLYRCEWSEFIYISFVFVVTDEGISFWQKIRRS